MIKNLGIADRSIRTLAAMVIVILLLTEQFTGATAVVLGIVAAALLVTSAIGFCPAYFPLKFSTLKKESARS
jgi:hypothetical protein